MFFLLAISSLFSQTSETNRELVELMNRYQPKYDSLITEMINDGIDTLPIGQRVLRIARAFESYPYLTRTLEGLGEEFCRFDLDGFDCVTLMENSLCIARVISTNNRSIEDYVACLTYTRYRDGKVDKYPSRLHYTADWIYQNTKNGVVKDITKELGGEPLKFQLAFMTDAQNKKHYPELYNDQRNMDRMKRVEQDINKRTYYYIPKEKVKAIESKLQSGDIIAITTKVNGLDYAHIGIAFRDNFGKLRLFHASSVYKKVIIDKELKEYLDGNKLQTGITVLRPLE